MNEEFVPCDDCVCPSGCLTRCSIQAYIKENINVAEQRSETHEQLWSEAQ